MKTFFHAVLAALISVSISSASGSCQIKAAFDIGSGTTKMKVAEVCGRAIRVLHEAEAPAGYRSYFRDGNHEAAFAEGSAVLKSLNEQAEQFNPVSRTGVATQAFRDFQEADAAAAAAFIRRLSESSHERAESRVSIEIVNQTREAGLGYLGALAQPDVPADAVIWDIGSGSMQITVDAAGTGYMGRTASGSFKDHIIRTQGGEPGPGATPNPLADGDPSSPRFNGAENAAAAAWNFAREAFDDPDVGSLRGRTVIGIGGVHRHSVRGQVNAFYSRQANSYMARELTEVLGQRAYLTDGEIGGNYASTEITNIALVLGFMNRLDIETVRAVSVNLTDGVLLDSSAALSPS